MEFTQVRTTKRKASSSGFAGLQYCKRRYFAEEGYNIFLLYGVLADTSSLSSHNIYNTYNISIIDDVTSRCERKIFAEGQKYRFKHVIQS